MRLSVLARSATVAAALLVSVALTAAPAHAAPSTDFYADSGDRCLYGIAKVTIDWNPPTASIVPGVFATGSVVDRPTPTDSRVCVDDLLYTVVTFSAYTRGVLVDTDAAKADNGVEPVRLLLTGARLGTIDTVVVQICRHSTVPTFAPVDYCGKRVAYTRPGVVIL